jgi:FixJ family two-component response regulator
VAILDDDQAVREALCDLLEVVGVATCGFSDAEVFLAAHSPGAFAGLITDVEMPGMSGLELQRRLSVLEPGLPVVVVSAAADPNVRLQALESGARAYLAKPMEHDLLLRQVMAMLAPR